MDEFVLPESLDGLSAVELDALLDAARDEANSITADVESADLDRLEELASAIETLETAKGLLAVAAAEKADKLAALNARINPAAEAEPDADEAVETLSDESGTDAGDVIAEGDLSVEDVVTEAVVAAVETPGQAVTLPKPTAKAVAARQTKPSPTAKAGVAIVAAAGIPGMRGGEKRPSLEDFVKPALSRWNSYLGHDGRIQDELFSLQAPPRDPRLVANGHNDQDVMAYAVSQDRLVALPDAPKGASGLVAAGGWCAPPEQKYEICTLAALDGILDVPTIGMPRGSISYFRQLDYSTVATAIAAGQFCFTDAELIALPPVVKPCFEIPCATPVTAHLDVCGLCLRAGLLQQKAFPELIAAWMHLALIAHAHFLNARNIAQMVAGSGAPIVETATFGAIAPLLDSLALRSMQYRLVNGMAENATLEVVLPYWIPGVLRSDQERRQFNSEDDVDWASDLSELNVRAQYVKDYQDAAFLAAAAAGTWPATVEYLLYAPGAWVRGAEDVISVSTLVDSTLLQTNRIQLLFIEAATIMLPYCGPSERVQVPICPSGATSGPIAAVPGTITCPAP